MSTSIAVLQFVALARGERAVRKPRNPFQVAFVEEQSRYCLRCCGLRTFDVIFTRPANFETAAICRCCGEVVAHPDLEKVNWVEAPRAPLLPDGDIPPSRKVRGIGGEKRN